MDLDLDHGYRSIKTKCPENMKLTFIKIASPLGTLSNISPPKCSTPAT
jgi:hypothetical protein